MKLPNPPTVLVLTVLVLPVLVLTTYVALLCSVYAHLCRPKPIASKPIHSVTCTMALLGYQSPWIPITSEAPLRGDWFWSKDAPTRIRCKEYELPPSPGFPGRLVSILQPGTSFGPVHKVQHHVYESFVSVQVPSREYPDMLVWINVRNKGTAFAQMYPRSASGFLD